MKAAPLFLVVNEQRVPLCFKRHRRARHYILSVTSHGEARVTIPRGGSSGQAAAFAVQHKAWFVRELRKRHEPLARTGGWTHWREVLFRGKKEPVSVAPFFGGGWVWFADQGIVVAEAHGDLRPVIRDHLHRLAARELVPLTEALARRHSLSVRRVTVRDQRTLWGSCSPRGAISLNWRLIQAPPHVRDYVITHELMHLKQLNHSRRFWRLVQSAFPGYREAERWLRQNAALLAGPACAGVPSILPDKSTVPNCL